MRAKFINEDIKDFLKPKSREEIFGDKEIVEFRSITTEESAGRVTGTYLIGEFTTSYEKLEKIFGPPINETDGYKVSTQWIVEDRSGNVCTIYDWKMIDTYGEGGYTIEEFRKLPNYEWHLGGKNNEVVNDLKLFLISKIYYES